MPCIPRSIPRSIFEHEALLYKTYYSQCRIFLIGTQNSSDDREVQYCRTSNFDVREESIVLALVYLVERLALLPVLQ